MPADIEAPAQAETADIEEAEAARGQDLRAQLLKQWAKMDARQQAQSLMLMQEVGKGNL